MFHVNQDNLQSKNKWKYSSSFSPQKLHKPFLTATLHLSKLTLVAILFPSNLHAVNWAEGKALILQKKLNIPDQSSPQPPLRIL